MKNVIKDRIETLLSEEFYCSREELNEKAIIYTVNSKIKQPYIKILAYRNCVVVCTSENLQSKIQGILKDKTRDEIFEIPLVYGQTIHYVPDDYTNDVPMSPDYEYETLFGKDILSLAGLTGFDNSLAFDENSATSTNAVYIARAHNKIIGIAGAAESTINGVWEIGVDVMEEYRNARLGTCLVRALTRELLGRNIIPFYSASVTNISSQMVANRCGYIPYWVDTFGNMFDGNSVYNNSRYIFSGLENERKEEN